MYNIYVYIDTQTSEDIDRQRVKQRKDGDLCNNVEGEPKNFAWS